MFPDEVPFLLLIAVPYLFGRTYFSGRICFGVIICQRLLTAFFFRTFGIYAMMGLSAERHSKAYNSFMKTALFDLEDLHVNTQLGIHAAAVGGKWQTMSYGFEPVAPEKMGKSQLLCVLEIKGR